MSVGILCRKRDQPAVSRFGIGGVERARCRRPVDADVGVVDDFRVARTEFQPAHEPRAGDGQRQHKDPEHVGAIGLQQVRLGKRHDQIGNAELPAVSPPARHRKITAVTFLPALIDPALNRCDLGIAQRVLSDERPVIRIDFPGRHRPISGDLGDLGRALADVAEGQQTERGRTARVMAHAAPVGHQRGDIAGIGERTGRDAARRQGDCKNGACTFTRCTDESTKITPRTHADHDEEL